MMAIGCLAGCSGSSGKKDILSTDVKVEVQGTPVRFSDVLRMVPEGWVGERSAANVSQWLAVAPYANAGIFEAFFQRDSKELAQLQTWYGEFPGKLLTGMGECLRLCTDEEREIVLRSGNFIVEQLAAAQGEDGYLGVFPQDRRLVGKCFDNATQVGDLWGHYHCMYGLLQWYHVTGNETARTVCLRAADYLCEFFQSGAHNVKEAGLDQFNSAVTHVFALLYEHTHEQRYLDMALAMEQAYLHNQYVKPALAGRDFFKQTAPRWEWLHAFLALPSLYRITGDEDYKTAFLNLWKSIRASDVHNTGAFSTGEGAIGNPYPKTDGEYYQKSIELCCTVAWNAMTLEYLRLTQDSTAADDLERAFYNNMLGSQHPTGRWVTYDTPMLGYKQPASLGNLGQGKNGAPEFSCCAANASRVIGQLSDWAVLTEGDNAVYVNYYGAGQTYVELDGRAVVLTQQTAYPLDGAITLTVQTDRKDSTAVYLRIPAWSAVTEVKLNGETLAAQPGSYLCIDRVWKESDTVTLSLDMTPHFLIADERYQYKASVYYGPILLACDDRFNFDYSQTAGVTFAFDDWQAAPCEVTGYPQPVLCLRATDTVGEEVILTDFATAGITGTYYTTWFKFRKASSHQAEAAAQGAEWSYRVKN